MKPSWFTVIVISVIFGAGINLVGDYIQYRRESLLIELESSRSMQETERIRLLLRATGK